MKTMYEVWQVFIDIENEDEPEKMGYNDILNEYNNYVWFPDYVGSFDNFEEAEECMKETRNHESKNYYTFEMRYIDEVEYKDDDEDMENGNTICTVKYYVKTYDKCHID